MTFAMTVKAVFHESLLMLHLVAQLYSAVTLSGFFKAYTIG